MTTSFRDQLVDCVPVLSRQALSLTRDRIEAEDLVQVTLEHALVKEALYVDTGPLIGWLTPMMRHLFIDQVRRRHRRERLETLTWGPIHGRGSIKPSQEDHRFLTELDALLGALPHHDRRIVLAVAVNGESYGQMARRLQMRTGTMGSRLSRARSTLRHAAMRSAPDPHRRKIGGYQIAQQRGIAPAFE